LGSIVLSLGLFLLGVFLNQFQSLKPMSLFGIDMNFSLMPKYFVGLLQWTLVLALFSKEHSLHNLVQYGTYLLLIIIAFDVLFVVMIKRHVASEWAISFHVFFYTLIEFFTGTYAMIVAILIHKFYRNTKFND
jgi:hypothetical protein